MRRILYIGGFEMPDKNAAAQRVLSIAKALKEVGYDTLFYGITECGDYQGEVDDFHYEARPRPSGVYNWFKYELGKDILKYIDSKQPDYIILYNYPAFAQEKIISYSRRKGIKTIGDITEWYRPKSLPQRIDTWYRMKISNKHLDGIIAISRYLADYYKAEAMIQLPPLVDKQEMKWQITPKPHLNKKINLVYIGTGSIKDRLDKIIQGIQYAGADIFHLDIIGIAEEQYHSIYQQYTDIDINGLDIAFHGRLPHKEALAFLMGADFQIFFRDDIRVNNAGFPTKFVESMSAGIPVITNRISNIDDYVKNGENSFMIEKPEEGEIHDVLKEVAELSKEDIEAIKEKTLKEEFDYRNHIASLKSFMESI